MSLPNRKPSRECSKLLLPYLLLQCPLTCLIFLSRKTLSPTACPVHLSSWAYSIFSHYSPLSPSPFAEELNAFTLSHTQLQIQKHPLGSYLMSSLVSAVRPTQQLTLTTVGISFYFKKQSPLPHVWLLTTVFCKLLSPPVFDLRTVTLQVCA